MKTSGDPVRAAHPTHPPSNMQRPQVYPSEARIARAGGAWFRERIASLVAKSKARHTVRELSSLSDRDLRDIGLLRADIPEVGIAASRPSRSTDGRAQDTFESITYLRKFFRSSRDSA